MTILTKLQCLKEAFQRPEFGVDFNYRPKNTPFATEDSHTHTPTTENNIKISQLALNILGAIPGLGVFVGVARVINNPTHWKRASLEITGLGSLALIYDLCIAIHNSQPHAEDMGLGDYY